MHHWIRVAIPLAAVVSAAGAPAQSIAGFKVGDDLRVVAKSHPAPFITEPLGSYTASKWDLPKGNTVSVTAESGTGRIVFIEADWGGDPAGAATDVLGMQFGTTTLADIREKFQSNGFAFKANIGQVTDDGLISFNCYQIGSDPDLIAVFITKRPIKDVAIVAGVPRPDLGKGHLDAVILASLAYLKQIWGEDRAFDATYHPVPWK